MNPSLKAIKLIALVLALAIMGGIALAVSKIAARGPSPSGAARPVMITGCGEFVCALMSDGSVVGARPREGKIALLTEIRD